jgi:hypothetical protein
MEADGNHMMQDGTFYITFSLAIINMTAGLNHITKGR